MTTAEDTPSGLEAVREVMDGEEAVHLDPASPDRPARPPRGAGGRSKAGRRVRGGRKAMPIVRLAAGETDAATDRTIELLRDDPSTFDYGGDLATAEAGRVYPLDPDSTAYHLGGIIGFEKWDARSESFKPCDPPPTLVRQLLSLGERRKLKPLDAVVTAPTVRLDGTVLDQPGYDPATRLLLDTPRPVGRAGKSGVIVSPSIPQARAALDVLLAPFAAFPFVDAAARGAMLAALLTAAVRAVLPTSPAFAFDAPVQGSGKTLLASCVGALVEGRLPDVWPHTANARDDEETRKRLFSALRNGSRALVWDNITGNFDSASMAAFITAPAMVDRVLGRSEAVRVPNRALLLLTGNNLSLAGDMPRRVLVCRIDPATPEPFARQFDTDPLAHCLAHRAQMLAAACTLIRARHTHPALPTAGRLASFEAWDELVRQTVRWADAVLDPGGFGDPLDLVRAAQEADAEADALSALLKALRSRFGAHEFASRDVAAAMSAATLPDSHADELRAAFTDLAGEKAASTVRGIGMVLRFRTGRIVRGLRLAARADSGRGVQMFRVVADEGPGLTRTNGSVPASRVKVSGDTFHKEGETTPLDPVSPGGEFDPGIYDPESWR